MSISSLLAAVAAQAVMQLHMVAVAVELVDIAPMRQARRVVAGRVRKQLLLSHQELHTPLWWVLAETAERLRPLEMLEVIHNLPPLPPLVVVVVARIMPDHLQEAPEVAQALQTLSLLARMEHLVKVSRAEIHRPQTSPPTVQVEVALVA